MISHIKKNQQSGQTNNFKTIIAKHQIKLQTPRLPLIVHSTLPIVIENAKKYVCNKKNINPLNIFVTVEPIDYRSKILAQSHSSSCPSHHPYSIILDSRLTPYFQKYPSAIKALMLMKVTDMYQGHDIIRNTLSDNVDHSAMYELEVQLARNANLLPALDNEKDAAAIHAYFTYHYPEIKSLMKNSATDNKDELLNFDFDFMHQHPYKTAEEVWRIKKMHEYMDLKIS